MVTLTVLDNNDCASLNIIPLQVLVSTIPTFPGMEDLTTCFGETATLTGNAESTTWTALPPQVVAGETYLADGAGFSYSTSLNFDFFEEGATLEDCDDLTSILVNMEHSYMGDLGIYITCPNGTSVDLVEWGSNGGGGTFLGEAVDDESTTPGVGYDYYWTPDATNGTWGENAGGFAESLPSGVYEAAGNLCDLVGCPLNGSWTFSVTDNLAIDNGYIFYWGINLNPALYPGITTFTPVIGAGADSSYWSGQHISGTDPNGDVITIDPPAPGQYTYTYHVLNNFGCAFDTTITVTFEQAPFVTAGPDQVYSCGALQLEGGFQDMDAPSCSGDGGTFTHCYGNGENFTWTFCPDNPGDGLTFITFRFISGEMEAFFDDFTIHDGPITSSPILENWSFGDATGLSWTAINPGGCLTISFSADGSISCADGAYLPWTYEVSCNGGGPQFTWEWTPAEFLSNSSIPSPTLTGLSQTTTFTLTGYPEGHPGCASTDEVVISIDPLGDPGQDTEVQVCSTDPAFHMTDALDGTPVATGEWTAPDGTPVSDGMYDPAVDPPGAYTYTVQLANCSTFSELNIIQALPTTLAVPNDTAVCYLGDLHLHATHQQGQSPFTYEWTYGGQSVSNLPESTYQPEVSGEACLTVTDACGFETTDCFLVAVEQPIEIAVDAQPVASCWPGSFDLTSLVDPALYNSMNWQFSDGTVIANDPGITISFAEPGTYDVGLQFISALGCTYEVGFEDMLVSHAPPIAQYTASPQPTDVTDTDISFTDASVGSIISHQWEITTGEGILTFDVANPQVHFPVGVGGVFTVLLTVTDINNCTAQVQGVIVINDILQYYLPNAFSPNDDGINDVFRLSGSDIDENAFRLQVFNRWGDVIFETTDPDEAWLGNSRGGDHYCPDGVYLWRARVGSRSTGERYDIEGHVTLIR